MAKPKKIRPIVNQAQPLPEKSDIRREIKIPTQLYRITTDLNVYRQAVLAAENIIIPQRFRLYQVYNMTDLDAHLTAVWQQRKNMTLGRKFCAYNPDNSVNEEKTKLLQKKWFRDYLDLCLDSKAYGYSLIQFDSVIEMNGEDEFKDVYLVPRIFVKPEFHIVTQDYAAFVGEDYLDQPYRDWVIGVGKPKDLGFYLKAAPLVIWKKNALGAWAEFVEKFGMPARIGKTNIRDEVTRHNMENMLKYMNVGLYAVLDKEDDIQYIEQKNQDAFQVFNMMIDRCNSEISKLVLGQTGTTDEKSFVGSAEVHERIGHGYAELDEAFMDGVNNYQLIPLLNGLGFGFEGLRIAAEPNDDMDLSERAKLDVELLKTGKFTMDPAYIKEKYNTEVIPVEDPTSVQSVQNKLDTYYS